MVPSSQVWLLYVIMKASQAWLWSSQARVHFIYEGLSGMIPLRQVGLPFVM